MSKGFQKPKDKVNKKPKAPAKEPKVPTSMKDIQWP